MTMAKILKPMHPGQVLREESLVPAKLSAGETVNKPEAA